MSEALLTEDLRSTLDTQGYVVVDDVMPLDVLDRMIDALAVRAAVYGQEVERAGGPPSYASRELSQQLMSVVKSGETWPGQPLDISLPKGDIAPDTPMFLEPEAFELLTEPRLLDVIERFIGPVIWLSPVGHVRLKLPHEIAPPNNTRLGTIGWHQDNGVLLEEADGVEILTVWIPLREATVQN